MPISSVIVYPMNTRRRAGRIAKPELRRRQVPTYLNPEEEAKARRLAAAEGLSVAAYLRRPVLLAEDPEPAEVVT